MKLFANSDTMLSNNGMLRKLPDILLVLLFIYLGEGLIQNPVFGLAAGLLAVFWEIFTWTASFHNGIAQSRGAKITGAVMLLSVLGVNAALFIVFPGITGLRGCAVLFIASAMMLLKCLLSRIVSSRAVSRARYTVLLTVIHTVFAALFTVLFALELPESYIPSAIVGYIFIDFIKYIRIIKHPALQKNKSTAISTVSSYRLFSQMSLYVSISFYLAIFMFMGYIITMPGEAGINSYALLLAWICVIGLFVFLFYKIIRRIPFKATVGVFIAGALSWIFSFYKLLNASGIVDGLLWSGFFAAGLALIYSALYRQNESFRQVSCIIDEDISLDSLMQSTDLVQTVAFSFAAVVLLAVLIIRPYSFTDPYEARLFSASSILLPFIFIALGIIMALRQPLDASSLDKLSRVRDGRGDSEMKQYLQNILVKKYRKRYGVRIISFFIKPFIYHKVYGRENVEEAALPAVFVCNHGEIYGPVTAVTHLPYYFRPWSQAKMLSYKEAKEYIYSNTMIHYKLPRFIKRAAASVAARAASWALNSFDPVPVYLGNIREVYKTMQASVQVLAEGDSLLLFPENPTHEESGRYATDGAPGAFYSGFAQIGIEYYKKYGKCVTFYPIFASKTKRTFRIGAGTAFNPEANRHDEKIRIADYLRDSMQELSKL